MKFNASMELKHNMLWLCKRGYDSLKSEKDLKTISGKYSLCEVAKQ